MLEFLPQGSTLARGCHCLRRVSAVVRSRSIVVRLRPLQSVKFDCVRAGCSVGDVRYSIRSFPFGREIAVFSSAFALSATARNLFALHA